MLYKFLAANMPAIVARARVKMAARATHVPTETELKNGVPLFLNQLIARMRIPSSDSRAIAESARIHGGELLAMGFTVSQVVHGYGDVCQVVTELADETDAQISADDFHTFNRCLDEAIAHSVTEYQRQRDEAIAKEGMERLGMLAHEMRNRLYAAMLSYSLLQDGTVSIGGSTGAVLGRNLRALQHLINNSLAGVRLESGLGKRHRISVAELIAEVELEASMTATAGSFRFTVSPVDAGVEIEGDQQILSAALGNLLQNAFKFSAAHGRVALRTIASADRVLLEVEDGCGGLPPGEVEDLFRAFEQRADQRTGLGLGLSISRKGVEAMGGTLGARDLPGKGCVFFIDFPRLPTA